MSITKELRDCIRTANRSYEDARNPYNDREILHIPEDELTAIADRIDAEHERMYEDLTIGMEPMTEENMARYGWVKLPVDADGVPIKLGDELEDGENLPARVWALLLAGDGWWCKSGESSILVAPSDLRHVKPDSWERIIADAIAEGFERTDVSAPCEVGNDELVERCRRLHRAEVGS